ncbi:MAG: general stress protein CsbD [Rubricoccaceae bacterium]|nr:general stress protein CsbD [Rubricoccaceae bacterium]
MSKQRMDENWQRVKSQILNVWGDLDESDMKKARGDLSQMVKLIHEKTGEDRSVIMSKMATLV